MRNSSKKVVPLKMPVIYESVIVSDNSDKRWRVKYCIDPEDGQILMWYAGDGGPIVKGTIGEVVRKFKEAMLLCEQIQKLLYFEKHGIFPAK